MAFSCRRLPDARSGYRVIRRSSREKARCWKRVGSGELGEGGGVALHTDPLPTQGGQRVEQVAEVVATRPWRQSRDQEGPGRGLDLPLRKDARWWASLPYCPTSRSSSGSRTATGSRVASGNSALKRHGLCSCREITDDVLYPLGEPVRQISGCPKDPELLFDLDRLTPQVLGHGSRGNASLRREGSHGVTGRPYPAGKRFRAS